jgi:hypothetical protein
MASRTTGEFPNLVLGDEPLPKLPLVTRRDVIHTEYSFTRTHEALRAAMAFQAPLHLQRLFLPHQWHPIDLTVARRAPDALMNVNAVVEVDEVGQIMDTRPPNR